LPISPRFYLSTALLLAVSGCSTTEGGLSAALEPQALQEQPADQADRSAVEDSLAWENSPLPEAVPFAPSARPELATAGLPAVMPAGYAGPTPTGAQPVAAQLALAASAAVAPPAARMGPAEVAARSPELDLLIAKYADHYDVPVALVRRVVNRESTFNPKARNGPYWGLMQILPATARTMGHSGPAAELLDAETNLKYAVRYLRGAYLVAGGNHDLAVRYYARGYYYDAKAKGLLEETGLGRDRRRMR
jgi:soluble lytic murein transglycosylase-like protein